MNSFSSSSRSNTNIDPSTMHLLCVPGVQIDVVWYSKVPEDDCAGGGYQQYDWDGWSEGGVVDGTVWTLRTSAHLANVQQVRWQWVEDCLVEAF